MIRSINTQAWIMLLVAVFSGAAALGQEKKPQEETPLEPAEETLPPEEEEGDQKDSAKKPVPEEKLFSLEEMIITATRTPRKILDTPRSLNLVDRERMEEINPLVAVSSLRYQTGIWLEQRTTTTMDPIIRGFAGSNLLALIDGNTLSTLWGEGGEGADDMYGKIDPDWVERIEVIRGPASVLYGSNAIGGVINFVTRDPALDYTEEGMAARARIKGTYGSAADEYRLRTEFHGATPIFRFMLGGSLWDTDDVEGGRGQGTLTPSSGEAANWDFTSTFIPFGEEHEFRLTYQDTNMDHIKRYYQPDEDNFLDRNALNFSYTDTAENWLWNHFEARFYYQYKEDRRDWISGPDEGLYGIQKIATYSGDLQITRDIGDSHRLTYGVHYELDDGESPGDEQLTMYPTDGSQKVKYTPDSIWQDLGLFVQDEWDFAERFTLIASARYDTFSFKSQVDDYYVPPLPGQDPDLDEISERTGEFSGGIGLNYLVGETTSLFGNYSRGFRLNPPNFGIWLVHGNAYRVPNAFLDPMVADQFEVGVKTTDEGFSAMADAYYTIINNTQREVPTTFQGMSFYDSNGNGIQEIPLEEYDYVAVEAGGKAVVTGVEFSADAQISTLCQWFGASSNAVDPGWSVYGGFAYEYGQDYEVDKPLQFTHPTYGYAALRYDWTELERPAWVELAGMFVSKYSRVYNEGGREWLEDPADTGSGYLRDYIGTPGYTVLDLRGGIEVWEDATLTLAVENLTDKRYRAAHSRMDAPGINFLASLDVWF